MSCVIRWTNQQNHGGRPRWNSNSQKTCAKFQSTARSSDHSTEAEQNWWRQDSEEPEHAGSTRIRFNLRKYKKIDPIWSQNYRWKRRNGQSIIGPEVSEQWGESTQRGQQFCRSVSETTWKRTGENGQNPEEIGDSVVGAIHEAKTEWNAIELQTANCWECSKESGCSKFVGNQQAEWVDFLIYAK